MYMCVCVSVTEMGVLWLWMKFGKAFSFFDSSLFYFPNNTIWWWVKFADTRWKKQRSTLINSGIYAVCGFP